MMKRVYNVVAFFALLAMSLSTIGCTEGADDVTPGGEVLTGDLVLSASAYEVLVTEDSSVEFTAMMGDTDVTDKLSLEIAYVDADDNISYVTGLTFPITESGSYNFYATCTNSEQKIVKSEIITVEAIDAYDLRLAASATSFIDGYSDNFDVEFSAYYGSTQITSFDDEAFKLYRVEGEERSELGSFDYTVDAVGDFTFIATYTVAGTEVESNEITLKRRSSTDDIAYIKRTIGLQFTATWCGYCPIMTSAIHHYEEQYGTDRSVFISAHGSDIMANDYSNYLTTVMGISGFPTLLVGSINTSKATNIGAYDYATTMGYIAQAVQNVEKLGVSTAIAVKSEVKGSEIEIDANVYVGKSGSFGVGAMLLEDGIIAKQTSYIDLDELNLEDYDTSNHKNVLQAFYPKSGLIPYVDLGDVENQSADTEYDFSCSFDIDDLTTLSEINNCRVVIYTYDTTSGYIDNIIQAPINTSRCYDLN
ncbi:MAG: Omp28-related outer membrane protein [Rikenellaceae bacterium]